ncbi:MAG: hypothetical protein CL878_02455 [Dehalococcoidia bacterium]|nr:hypothetical protein [Dehalococcoidia bacterium]
MTPTRETRATVHEPAREVPVLLDVDVVVAGAGIAGIFAALSAAKRGARTVLIDRFGSVGGNYGPGLGSRHDLWQHPSLLEHGLGGVVGEFLTRLEAVGGLEEFDFTGGGDRIDWSWKGMRKLPVIHSDTFGYLALRMLEEAGVQLLLSTDVAGAIVDGTRVTGVFVETKSGRRAVLGRAAVDSTGDADIAASAGAPTVDTYALRSASIGLFFRVGGVDWERYEQFRSEAKAKPLPPDLEEWRTTVFEEALRRPWPNYPHDLMPAVRAAWESGEYRYVQTVGDLTNVYLIPFGIHNQAVTTVEMTPTPTLDPTNALHRSLLESRFRQYIYESVRFLQRYAPGFEHVYIEQIAPFMGTRFSRTIEPEYTLTPDDIWGSRTFDDVVHRLTHYESREKELVDFNSGEEGVVYELPYRMLLPQQIDGLLVAGRAANAEVASRLRARWMVMLTGAIAGVAAALAAADDVTPRALDPRALQQTLLDDGFYLGDDTRLAELGLTGS